METPALSVLGVDADGDRIGISVFRAQIISMLEFLSINWSEGAEKECAQYAYDECYWMSLAEVKQFFIRVKTGRYVSNKNISPAVLLEFLTEYSNEMHAERGKYYSGLERKKKVITLDVKHIPEGRPKKFALWKLRQVAKFNEDMFNRMREIASSFVSHKEDPEIEKQKVKESKAAAADKLRAIGVPEALIQQYWKP